MITIDQAKIDAPNFPREQTWWDGFAPVWIDAAVRANGTVELEPSGRHYAYGSKNESGETAIVYRKLTAAQERRTEASIRRWIEGLPRLAVAIVPEGSEQA